MKSILAILIIALLIPVPTFAQSDAECTSEAVAEWIIQREVGQNQIRTLLEWGAESDIAGLLQVQEIRRNLEDLPRPDCADQLFLLTILYYNGLADSFSFAIAEDDLSAARIAEERLNQYDSEITAIYQELQAIANIDAAVEAANIQILPTATPNYPPAEEIVLNGDVGGVLEAPVNIPPGAYRLRFESFGGRGVTAQADLLSGWCDTFYTFTTSELRSVEAFFRSEGCELAISIGQTDMGWILSLTPIE